MDGQARFVADPADRGEAGLSDPRVLEDGPVIERAAVNFTHSRGAGLPEAATQRHPQLAGLPFEAVSLSLIVHPRNPYAPTTHANFRCFVAGPSNQPAAWWVGGGFDLTPYYGFDADTVAWHRAAQAACAPSGPGVHADLKARCDAYFHLDHRGEQRGVGGVFFDDWTEGGWTASLGLLQRVGEAFWPAYRPILVARSAMPYGENQRRWQLIRRGRYVEFNLIQDRGTRYGLQSGRRIEAVLGSMPPAVAWAYQHQPTPGSPEAELLSRYLVPRDWLADGI